MPDAPFLIEHGVAIPQNAAMRDQFVAIQQAINSIRAMTGQPPIKTDGSIGDETVKALSAVARDYGNLASSGPITPAFIAGLAPTLLKELHGLIERMGAGAVAPHAPAAHATAAHPAASSPRITRTSSTQSAAKTMLEKETNARFWAQTGYKVGQKLDPAHNATDRAMSKIWMEIFAKVQREDAAGKLVLTYNHPKVEQHLEDASVATAAAVHHLDAAANAQSDAERDANVRAASTAANMSKDKARGAAAYQPASVSADVTQEAHGDIGQHLSDPNHAREVAGSSYDQLAVAQAATTATASSHAGKSVQSSVSSATIAGIRERAADLAKLNGPFVGVVISPDGSVVVEKFKSREEMYHWYDVNSAHGDHFKYIAMFDKDEPNGPAADMFGGSAALTVSVQMPPPADDVAPMPPAPAPKKSSGWLIAGIVAAVGVAGGIAFAASKRNTPSKPTAGRGRVAR